MPPMRYGKQPDTASPLFTKLFMCRYPLLQSKEVEELRNVGLYSTGDKRTDKDILSSSLVTGMLCIDKMVELYKQNCPIYIVHRKDSVKIYELIQDHLHAWNNHLDRGINTRNAPIEDLIVLDEFAEKMFGYVRHTYKTDGVTNDLHKKLLELNPNSPMSFLRNKPKKTENRTVVTLPDGSIDVIKNNKKEELPTRGSFADSLKENLILLKGFQS